VNAGHTAARGLVQICYRSAPEARRCFFHRLHPRTLGAPSASVAQRHAHAGRQTTASQRGVLM